MNDTERDAVGRAAHEAWKGWIVQGGYADHTLVKRVVGSTANGDDRYVCATCADSRGMSGHGVGYTEPFHHPDMVPWGYLPEEKRGKYLATGMAGYAAAEAEIAALKAELDQNRYERHLLANGIDQWQSRAEQAEAERDRLRREKLEMESRPYWLIECIDEGNGGGQTGKLVPANDAATKLGPVYRDYRLEHVESENAALRARVEALEGAFTLNRAEVVQVDRLIRALVSLMPSFGEESAVEYMRARIAAWLEDDS